MISKILKISSVILCLVIFIFWIGNFWLGIPAEVVDNACEGIIPSEGPYIKSEIKRRRVISLFYLIPIIGILGYTLYSIYKEKKVN